MLGHFLRKARSRRQAVDDLIRQVAEACVDGVCRCAADRIVGMNPSEARGYLRARAGLEIRRQTQWALARAAHADLSWQATIVVRAADRVSSLALRRLSATAGCTSAPQRRAA
jgi:hypothetical protein